MDEFTKFDQRQPHLLDIERWAEMIVYYSGRIVDASERIEKMPDYETRAGSALDAAIARLAKARATLITKESRVNWE